MTSSKPIILGLRVESFRGFRDAREFDLSASAVIVTGPNGTGKTSFFDALQWALLGSLQRLADLRSRPTVEHIVNQYRLGRKANVEIDLLVGSTPISVRRTGDHHGSTLELRLPGGPSQFGAEAEVALRHLLLPHTDLSLESALMTSGLMQQDVMRRVLEAKPADRYRQLSTVLGLGALEDFEEAARGLAKQAAEHERGARAQRDSIAELRKQTRGRLAAAEARLESRPQVDAVRDEVRAVLGRLQVPGVRPRTQLSLGSPDEVRQVTALFGAAIDLVSKAADRVGRVRDLRATLTEEPTAAEWSRSRADLEHARSALADAEDRLRSTLDQLDAARNAASEISQLAALAIPMLLAECPVCGQTIAPADVERRLRDRVDSTDTIVALQQTVTAETANHKEAAARALAVGAALDELEVRAAAWAKYREAMAESEAALQRLRDDGVVLEVDQEFPGASDMGFTVLEEYLRVGRAMLLDLVDTFERQAEQGTIDRARAEVATLESSLVSAEGAWSDASTRARRLKGLADHSVTARVEVTETRLRAIQPLVANIFQRLDPHPSFKTVEFELDTYYRRGTTSPLVTDVLAGVSADPLVIFSTSQANIVALSYFIAMSLSAEDRGLPFLLLDDAVQSMDDVNVLGFADLCRHLRSRRQLIVSTHERRFAGLLERKLAPRSAESATRVIRFTGWDRSGPTVETYTIDSQLLDDPIRVVQRVG